MFMFGQMSFNLVAIRVQIWCFDWSIRLTAIYRTAIHHRYRYKSSAITTITAITTIVRSALIISVIVFVLYRGIFYININRIFWCSIILVESVGVNVTVNSWF
jgi:hypothetical protein